jgi:hypothetical protein
VLRRKSVVAFSPCGNWMVTGLPPLLRRVGGTDRTLKLWDYPIDASSIVTLVITSYARRPIWVRSLTHRIVFPLADTTGYIVSVIRRWR